jgi:hypothetical protein
MSQRQVVSYDIGTQSTVVGTTKAILARDFRNAIFDVVSAAGANQVLKFVASKQEDKPDFNSAVSNTNRWQYVQCIDLNTGNPIDGTVGYTFTGVESKQFELNLNGEWWIGAYLASGTTGSINTKVLLTDNL